MDNAEGHLQSNETRQEMPRMYVRTSVCRRVVNVRTPTATVRSTRVVAVVRTRIERLSFVEDE